MSGNVEFVVNPEFLSRSSQGSKAGRGAYQITLQQSQDWARAWPREDGVGPLFRLVVLPTRLLALGLLWATSAPGRLLFTVGLAAVVTVALIAR